MTRVRSDVSVYGWRVLCVRFSLGCRRVNRPDKYALCSTAERVDDERDSVELTPC